jgi:hypothetical protein
MANEAEHNGVFDLLRAINIELAPKRGSKL